MTCSKKVGNFSSPPIKFENVFVVSSGSGKFQAYDEKLEIPLNSV